jgi:hypothetical protein
MDRNRRNVGCAIAMAAEYVSILLDMKLSLNVERPRNAIATKLIYGDRYYHIKMEKCVLGNALKF